MLNTKSKCVCVLESEQARETDRQTDRYGGRKPFCNDYLCRVGLGSK